MKERGLEISELEAFIESFATAALGLTLVSRVDHLENLAVFEGRRREPTAASLPSASCAWQTDRGTFAVIVQYDEAQSALVKANVLLFEWWIGPNVHHKGWYHCYPKFPRDWVKGPGRVNRY